MLQANYDEPAFHVKNPSVTSANCDQNQDISFRLINKTNEILVKSKQNKSAQPQNLAFKKKSPILIQSD